MDLILALDAGGHWMVRLWWELLTRATELDSTTFLKFYNVFKNVFKYCIRWSDCGGNSSQEPLSSIRPPLNLFKHHWSVKFIISDHHIGNTNILPLSSWFQLVFVIDVISKFEIQIVKLSSVWFQIVTFAAFSASFTWISAKAISSCLMIQFLHYAE